MYEFTQILRCPKCNKTINIVTVICNFDSGHTSFRVSYQPRSCCTEFARKVLNVADRALCKNAGNVIVLAGAYDGVPSIILLKGDISCFQNIS